MSITFPPQARKDFSRLCKAVSNQLRSHRTQADIEEISEQVLLLCIEKGYKPSKKIIRHVIIDWRRHKKVIADAQYTYLKTRTKEGFDPAYVHHLITSTPLTANEQEEIWQVYWNGTKPTPVLKQALLKLFIQARKES